MCACIAGATTVNAAAASGAALTPTALPGLPGAELEPNNTLATASPIASGERVRASLPLGDADCYRFAAQREDRVFANTVTAGSTGGFDTVLKVLDANGVPVAEDDDDGSQYAAASSIAGATIPEAGVYCLEVSNGGTAGISTYDLYFQLRSGVPTPELDASNGAPSGADPVGPGWVAGQHNGAGDEDWFSLPLQAGDAVFLSLAIDGDASKVQMGLGLAVDPSNPLFALGKEETPDSAAPSEALTMTVSSPGLYYVKVASSDEASADTWSYELSATVLPAARPSCYSYPSAVGEIKDGRTTIFPIPVAEAVQIRRAAVAVNLVQSVMADLDISLRTSTGIELPLVNDIGSASPGGQTQMDVVLDDFAAVPPLYKTLRPLDLQPLGGGRLALLVNQQSQGTWSLVIKDGQLNSSSGKLNAASLVFCGPGVAQPPGPGDSGGGSAGSPPSQGAPRPDPSPQSSPLLSDFAISPSRFRAARAGPMLLAKRSRRGGALVSYQSSDAAQTHFVLFELEEGRRVRRKCVRATALNSTRKPCVRRVKVITFVRDDAAGRNQFGFSGRVGARKLPPGEYQLQARAYAASGLTSAPVGATFTVLPPVPRQAIGSRR